MDKKFILTQDPETATLLSRYLDMVSENNGSWIFVNKPEKIVFENLKNITYTNILSI